MQKAYNEQNMKCKFKDGILGARPTSHLLAHLNCSLTVTGRNDLQLDLALLACAARKPEGGDASGSHCSHHPSPRSAGRCRDRAVGTGGCGARVPCLNVRHTCARALPGWLLSASRGSGPGSALPSRAHPELRLCTVEGPGLRVGEFTRNPSCKTSRWGATLPGASVPDRNTPGSARWQRHLLLLPSPFDGPRDPRNRTPAVTGTGHRGKPGRAKAGQRGRRGRRRKRVSPYALPLSGSSQSPRSPNPGPAPGARPASRPAGNN